MRSSSNGFTLMEVVIALFLIAVGVTATAPLFVVASRQNAGGGDMGIVGSAAVQRMESLRSEEFGLLPNGGSLTADVNGFFDSSDPDVVVRWTIADNTGGPADTKIISVRAVSAGDPMGRSKETTLIMLRAL